MGVAERIHEVDDVPEPSSYQSQRQRARAIKVARVSRRGKWAKYAKSRNKQTLYTITTRINARDEWKGMGTLEARYVREARSWVLYLRFAELYEIGYAKAVEQTPDEERIFHAPEQVEIDNRGAVVPDDDEPATAEEEALWAEIEARQAADWEG